ncbi:hypothetical protein QCB44_06330 [Thiomicrorhabdus sp. zzn3]|uniref:hypothetical protein n=1 Tax=Thiomicrorhabdus sp. zzn3 TaxID=3039775 RepID=UPI0024365C17|nr:hypothetical protein [Thiomicrorhabdus sp. zzn3]MDG6778315.1 hypothetical protein [Thiomicrorhabdus sp. zzn3]
MDFNRFEMLKVVLESDIDNILDLVKSLKEFEPEDNFDFSVIKPWHDLYLLDFREIISQASGVSRTESTLSLEKRYEFLLKLHDKEFWKSWISDVEKHPNKQPKSEPQLDYDKNFPAFYVLLKSYECILIHKTSMQSLFKQLEQNDLINEETLHKVLQIDKTIIFYPPVRNRINEAVVYNDSSFLKNLSKAISSEKLTKPNRRYPDLIFATWLLVENGYYDQLSKDQKVSFLKKYYSDYKEPESLFREVNRIIKSLKT